MVPPGCWLKVGDEKRPLVEGKVVGAFDESYEHEAANESNQARLVLYIDVWNPQLSESDIPVIDAACRLDFETPLIQRWSQLMLPERDA
jgi:hypothetical protein